MTLLLRPFRWMLGADEHEQHQLKLIKVNMHLQVKSGWYDWKLQWVEQLFETADDSSQALDKVRGLVSHRQRGSDVDVEDRITTC
jgi:hypothetical protein